MKLNLSFLQFLLSSLFLVHSAYAAPKKVTRINYRPQPTTYSYAQASQTTTSKPLVNLEIMAGLSTLQSNQNSGAAGLGIQFALTENFSVGPEFLYLQKGSNLTSGTETFNFIRHSLEIPILAKLRFGSQAAKIEFFAGPSMSLSLSTDGIPSTQAQNFDPSAIDFSIHAGMGVRFNLSHNTSLFATGRYIYGLSSFNQFDQPNSNSSGLLFMGGLSFGL